MDRPMRYRGPVIWRTASEIEEDHAMLEYLLEEYGLSRPQIRAAMELMQRQRVEELRELRALETTATGMVTNPDDEQN